MLPDEEDPIGVVEDDDAGREVGEMDHAVDPGGAVRTSHLVVPDRDPGVLVGDPPVVSDPRAVPDRRVVSHAGIVACGTLARPPGSSVP